MFDEREWFQIVSRLTELTRSEKLRWHFEEHQIVVAPVGDIEYVLGSVDKDGRAPYYLGIWDPQISEHIARLESEPVPQVGDWSVDPAEFSAAQLVPTLHTLANRSASGAPRKLNQLLADLQELDENLQ